MDLIRDRQEGYGFDQAFYVDPEVYALEEKTIFRPMWLYAGHNSQIPHAGDFFTLEFFGENIIVNRGEDDQVNALYNVCRHRGSRVCLDTSGNAKTFSCPYHAWTYLLDGSLHHANHMDDGFCRDEHGLHRCHVRVMEGFIFICLAESPPDFDGIERDLVPLAEQHGFAKSKIAYQMSSTLPCNWKVLGENFSECYHCGPAHPEYCSRVLYAAIDADPNLLKEGLTVHARAIERFEKLGLSYKPVVEPDKGYHFGGRNPLREGSVSTSETGLPIAPRMGNLMDDDAGNLCLVVRPTFILEASADCATVLRFIPDSVLETRVEVYWFVHEDAREGVDYQIEELIWFWKTTADQDFELCINNQAGINSAKYQPGPLSQQERGIIDFQKWYLQNFELQ